MSPLLLAACLAFIAPARAAESAAAFVRYQAPKGWQAQEYANGADSVKEFVRDSDRLTVRLYGSPGSSYKTPADFLAGAAASTMGRPPEKAGSAVVAGRKTMVYKRGFPVNLGDPHTPSGGQQMLGSEVFVVLPPAKGRFVVLSWARETPAPDLERAGEKAWAAFLKTIKRPGRKT